MRIKKIELTGFKSFKEKTSLFFSPGLTGIVGPNGCGKSNIVDALLWVMGDMSSKHLRGSSMSDVIFSGTEETAPLGMAEVSLVLENHGGFFPPKYFHYSEIMITRRLHKSGESEYLINKEFVRLKDIQDIFIDTGVGAKGFSIIEQESIGKIVTAKPEERKSLIEEVAGVTRFQMRKKESQRKLQVTEQNILRLEDILSEKRKQVQRLERQVKKAEKYKKVKEEIKKRDLFLAYRRSAQFSESIGEKRESLKLLKEKEELLQTSVLKWESEKESLNLELSKKEDEVKRVQEDYKNCQDLLREKEDQIRDLSLEIQKQVHKKEMALSLMQQFTRRFETYTQDLKEEKEKLKLLLEDSKRLKDLYKKEMDSFQKMQEESSKKESFFLKKKEEQNELFQEAFKQQSQVQSLRAQREEQDKRKEEAEKSLKALKLKEKEQAQKLKDSLQNLKDQKILQEKTFREVEKEMELSKELEEKRTLDQEELNEMKSQLTQVSERLTVIKDLQLSYEGFQEGTRYLLKTQETRDEKSFSLLAHFIEVPSRYEVAVESALGKKLEILFLHRESSKEDLSEKEVLKNILKGLKEKRKGRSSFFYSNEKVIQSRKILEKEDLGSSDQKVVFLSEVVKVSDELSLSEKVFVLNLLSQFVVASSLDEAFELKEKFFDLWVVTLEGDLFTPQGVVTGGSFQGLDKGLLNQKNQISELELKKEEILSQVLNQEKIYEEVSQKLKASQLRVETLSKNQDQQKVLMLESIKDQRILESERASLIQSIQKQEKEIAYHEERVLEFNASLEELEGYLNEVEKKKGVLSDEIETFSSEWQKFKEKLEVFREKVTRIQIEWAQKDQEKEEFSNRVKKIEKSIGDLTLEKRRVQKESDQSEKLLLSQREVLGRKKEDLEKVLSSLETKEKTLSHLQDEFEESSQAVKAIDGKLSEAYQRVHQCKTQGSDLSLKLEELKLKLENLEGQIKERQGKDLTQLVDEYQPIFEDFNQQEIEEVANDLKSLEEKLKSIGEVYLLAIDEQKELKKSLDFLTQQLDELVHAKKELNQVMAKIDRICTTRFRESFHEVSLKFSKVFPILFGGGKARLSLVEGEEGKGILGIEIEAEPPGKKLKNIKLLSGGEKALTALALVFSIFLLKPSPFCILDEVDAPLDDANVFRFNALLSEMVRYSQVVLVTHNKYSMKMSDFLFGVTMEKKGISKIVSVQLDTDRQLESKETFVDGQKSLKKVVSKEV